MSDLLTATPNVPTSRPVHGTRRTWVRVAWAIAVVVVLAVVVHPWWLTPMVERDLAARSGRAVHFDSIRLGLTSQLAPVAVLRGVRIANAPWGDTSVPFAALDEARFEFAWHRTDGRFVVSKMVLRGGETHLERHPDGRRNWRLRQPDDRGPGHYWFDALEAHDASLTFRDPAIDMMFHGAATDASGASSTTSAGEALTTRIVFDGSVRGVAYKGDLLTGRELTFRDTGRWFAARGSADVAGARLDVDGRAADVFLGARVDADATLDGRSLAALRALARRPGEADHAGPTASPQRAFHVAGHLRVEPHRYALEAATATVGSTDLRGDATWSQASAPAGRPALRARLVSEKTDIADLMWLAGRDASAAPARAVDVDPGAKAGTDPFAALRDIDADVAFDAAHLSFAAFHPLQSLKISAALSGGRMTIGELDVGWGGGHTVGRGALDLRQPRATSSVEMQTHGVRLDAVLPQTDAKKRVTGTLAGTLTATVTGDDLDDWRDSVSGNASLTVRDGTISSFLDAAIGLEAGKMVRTLLSGAEPLALPCAGAAVSMQDGRGKLRDLVIDSENTRTTGSGTIDLRDGTIDIVLTPKPKRPGLDLSRSIRLHGRLPKPERSLVERVAEPAVGTCAPAKP